MSRVRLAAAVLVAAAAAVATALTLTLRDIREAEPRFREAAARLAGAAAGRELAARGFGGRVTNLNFTGVRLGDVLVFFAGEYGMNIIAPPPSPWDGVSVRCDDVTAVEALDSIVRSKGLGLLLEGDILHVVTRERCWAAIGERFPGALRISWPQARAALKDAFDDAANDRLMAAAAARCDGRVSDPTGLARYLLEEWRAKRLSGIDLDLAAGIVGAHAPRLKE